MTDRATQAFLEEITKAANSVLPGQSGVRKRPPGLIPDEGIVQQQKVTARKNTGALSYDAGTDTQQLKDTRVKKVRPGQPESPWRIAKVGEDKLAEDRQFLLDADVSPIQYANELMRRYDRGWLSWEPETLWETIRKDWLTFPNEEAKNKIMALKTVMANETFWREWEVFEKVCSAFNDCVPSFGNMEDLSIGELALAVQLVNKLKRRPFGNETQAYVASRAHEDGYVLLPEVLAFAQDYLDTLMQGTGGPDVRDKLAKLPSLLEFAITDDLDPVHVQAGMLQAVHLYVKSKDTLEVTS